MLSVTDAAAARCSPKRIMSRSRADHGPDTGVVGVAGAGVVGGAGLEAGGVDGGERGDWSPILRFRWRVRRSFALNTGN